MLVAGDLADADQADADRHQSTFVLAAARAAAPKPHGKS
jgi:hypothetical protein